jgi:hypothetical protein
LSRKQLFRLRKPRYGALNPQIFAVFEQINAREKPAFHRCFCDVRNLRGRYACAQKNFSAREHSMPTIKENAPMARGSYTQY